MKKVSECALGIKRSAERGWQSANDLKRTDRVRECQLSGSKAGDDTVRLEGGDANVKGPQTGEERTGGHLEVARTAQFAANGPLKWDKFKMKQKAKQTYVSEPQSQLCK